MKTKSKVPQIPKGLEIEYLNRNVILFVGSGISMEANAPSWKKLLIELVNKIADEEKDEFKDTRDHKELISLINEGNSSYLIAADYIKSRLKEKFDEYIIEIFSSLKFTEIHTLITKLNIAGVITTNFDNLIELAYNNRIYTTPKVILPEDTYQKANIEREIKNNRFWIYKIHGTCEQPQTIVFSQFDYDTINKSTLHSLSNLISNCTILFIGYSLSDFDIINEFNKINNIYSGKNKRHYALISGSIGQIKKDYFKNRYNIQILNYTTNSNSHIEVSHFLNNLSNFQAEQISKVLLLIKGYKTYGLDGKEVNVLIRDDNPQWKISVQKNGDKEVFEKSYLLPSITFISLEEKTLKEQIEKYFSISQKYFEIEIDKEVFISNKFNPSTEKQTQYTFYFIKIKFSDEKIESFDLIQGNQSNKWITMQTLRNHRSTMELNKDVIIEMSKRYGGFELSKMEYSFKKSIGDYNDIYSIKSGTYETLPWVTDEKIFELCLPKNYDNYEGIVDLGCGTGILSKIVNAKSRINYIGVDISIEMINLAVKNVGPLNNVAFVNKNILTDNFEPKYDKYLFVIKNVLHLIPALMSFFKSLRFRIGNPKEILIIETVSPSLEALSWIQLVFELIGYKYKYNWFVEKQLQTILRLSGLEIINEQIYDQYIDLDLWLASFNLTVDQQNQVVEFIDTTPKKIKDEMLNYDNAKQKKMLRRQIIIRAKYKEQ